MKIREGLVWYRPHGTTRGMLYLSNFLLAIHLFVVLYVNSSYLATFVGEDLVGLIYIFGSILSLASFFLISRVLARFGNIRTLTGIAILEFLIFIGLAFPGHPAIAILLFIGYLVLYPFILYCLDILLERYTDDERETGSVRGLFLTITSLGIIIAPLLAGLVVGDEQYARVFIFAALFLIPFLVIIRRTFRTFTDGHYTPLKPRFLFTCLTGNRTLFTIFKAHFLMQLFFAWMVIYTPIYLHEHIGFDWGTLGVIFTIMLIPYAFEAVLGKIADRWWGEKEMLTLGFVLTACFVGIMSFVTSVNPLIWAGILLMTRVGAALLESMTEVYFFRHVDSNDANTISCFRMLRPLAYIIAPLVGVLALFFIDIQYLFILFGVIILFGLRYSLSLKDTR